MTFELAILDAIQKTRTHFLDVFMKTITHLGDGGVFWILVTLALLIIPKTRKIGIMAAISLIMEVLINNVTLKPLVARIRPYDIRTDITLLISKPTDWSFPSGHSGASFAVASAMCFGKSKWGIPAVILALIISFSRLYLYVHYPTDVLAGIALGILTGWLARLIFTKAERRLTERRSKP